MAKILKGATAQETHSAILDLIRSSGTVTRVDLADRSGLTGASISRVVKQLLADGLIIETGLGDPTGGKRATARCIRPGSSSRSWARVLLRWVLRRWCCTAS